MIETIILLLITGTLNIACFFIGAKVGQKVVKGEEIKLPEVKNPFEGYKDKKKAEAEQAKIDTILENIEAYNGTSSGQKDV